MALHRFFQELVNTKPLLLVFQVTVLVALVSSAFYIGKQVNSGIWFSQIDPDAGSIYMVHTFNSSQTSAEITVNKPLDRESGISTPSSLPQNIWTQPIWDAPPVGTKMPNAKDLRLTKTLVEYRAKDNIIIATFGNYAFMDFILNWVRHLTDLGVGNLLVGAMDTKLLESLYWKGIPVFDMGSNMNTTDVGWGSPAFHKMGRQKVIFIDAILSFGYELLMCDTDMVWLKNPLPYFARFPGADILTSSDQLAPTVSDDSLEVWEKVVVEGYNIGIFHWRPTESAKKLAKEWKDMLLADEMLWDQYGFNDLMQKRFGPSVEGEPRLVYAFDGSLKLGILPSSIFCSGHTYFVQAMYQQLRLEPYAAHTTFQFSGTDGKRHRLREAMLFYDQPEYYDSLGGFLSYKPSIPKRLLLDGPHNIDSHFSLVNYQLKQVRSALAIASLLNRTLVMPPLWCRLDKLWFPHPGVLPGTMTRQPFLCPLDHVFEVNIMLKDLPEEEFGPGIDFREYSFLDNPLLSEQVKESKLEVQLCEAGSFNCQIGNETTESGVLRFPKNSTEEMFQAVFSSYKDVKVIEFLSMDNAFQGFTNKVRQDKFRNRVKRYVGKWCCLEHRDLGHIYYDIYWDEKPNWKPAPPATAEDDHPPW